MKDDDPLLREVIADDALAEFRRTSLVAGLDVIRRQRRRRRTRRTGLAVVAVTAALAWAGLAHQPPPQRQPTLVQFSAPSPTTPATVAEAQPTPAPIEIISDQELFALFPDRAKALIGPPGRRRFVFLDNKPAANAADE